MTSIEIRMVKEMVSDGGPELRDKLLIDPGIERKPDFAEFRDHQLQCRALGCVQELEAEGHKPLPYAEVIDRGLMHVYEVRVGAKGQGGDNHGG